MTNYITSDTELTAIADAIRNKASVTADLVYPNDFVSTINNITIYGGAAEPTLTAATVTITPSASAQTTTITPGVGYGGLSSVSVQVPAIASNYVGSGITRRSSTDLTSTQTVSRATIAAPSGYYETLATITLALPWELISSGSITTATTTTSAQTTSYRISCGSEAYTKDKIIYVRVRDSAGPKAGYFWGTDTFFINYYAANNATTALTYGLRMAHRYSTSSTFASYNSSTSSCYGIYPYSITSAGVILFYRRYNATYSLTIDGTYTIQIFSLTLPTGYTNLWS